MWIPTGMVRTMRFAEEATQAFSFLEDAGIRLTHSGPWRLQYETDQVFVTIDWDPRSGELNVYLGLQQNKAEAGASICADFLT